MRPSFHACKPINYRLLLLRLTVLQYVRRAGACRGERQTAKVHKSRVGGRGGGGESALGGKRRRRKRRSAIFRGEMEKGSAADGEGERRRRRGCCHREGRRRGRKEGNTYTYLFFLFFSVCSGGGDSLLGLRASSQASTAERRNRERNRATKQASREWKWVGKREEIERRKRPSKRGES